MQQIQGLSFQAIWIMEESVKYPIDRLSIRFVGEISDQCIA